MPPGFAITAAAYELFLSHNQLPDEINRRLQSMEEEDISDLYRKSSGDRRCSSAAAELPPELAEAISQAYDGLARRTRRAVRVALRSSAIGEDAAETSFAGQYHSELNVSRENLLTVYKEILASKYALTAVSYRLHRGLRDEDVAMCVGCMAMVDSVCGGVMYSRDPTDLRRRCRSSSTRCMAWPNRWWTAASPRISRSFPGRSPWPCSEGDPGQGTQSRLPARRKGCCCKRMEGRGQSSRMSRPWTWPALP